MKPDPPPATLGDAKWWQYCGRCRHCGHHEVWSYDKEGLALDDKLEKRPRVWIDFFLYVKSRLLDHYAETNMASHRWLEHCISCDNYAVFELTAMSKDE